MSGSERRMFSVASSVWPPARMRAPSPCRRRRPSASCSVPGLTYAKLGAFMARSGRWVTQTSVGMLKLEATLRPTGQRELTALVRV